MLVGQRFKEVILSFADKVYKDLVREILINGTWDYGDDVRTKYADGSTANTKSIFGYQVKFPKVLYH